MYENDKPLWYNTVVEEEGGLQHFIKPNFIYEGSIMTQAGIALNFLTVKNLKTCIAVPLHVGSIMAIDKNQLLRIIALIQAKIRQ